MCDAILATAAFGFTTVVVAKLIVIAADSVDGGVAGNVGFATCHTSVSSWATALMDSFVMVSILTASLFAMLVFSDNSMFLSVSSSLETLS